MARRAQRLEEQLAAAGEAGRAGGSKRRSKRRFAKVLLLGGVVAVAVKPQVRNRVLDALFGPEEQFEYDSLTEPIAHGIDTDQPEVAWPHEPAEPAERSAAESDADDEPSWTFSNETDWAALAPFAREGSAAQVNEEAGDSSREPEAGEREPEAGEHEPEAASYEPTPPSHGAPSFEAEPPARDPEPPSFGVSAVYEAGHDLPSLADESTPVAFKVAPGYDTEPATTVSHSFGEASHEDTEGSYSPPLHDEPESSAEELEPPAYGSVTPLPDLEPPVHEAPAYEPEAHEYGSVTPRDDREPAAYEAPAPTYEPPAEGPAGEPEPAPYSDAWQSAEAGESETVAEPPTVTAEEAAREHDSGVPASESPVRIDPPAYAPPMHVEPEPVAPSEAPEEAPDAGDQAPESAADAPESAADAPESAADAPESAADGSESAAEAPESAAEAPEPAIGEAGPPPPPRGGWWLSRRRKASGAEPPRWD